MASVENECGIGKHEIMITELREKLSSMFVSSLPSCILNSRACALSGESEEVQSSIPFLSRNGSACPHSVCICRRAPSQIIECSRLKAISPWFSGDPANSLWLPWGGKAPLTVPICGFLGTNCPKVC